MNTCRQAGVSEVVVSGEDSISCDSSTSIVRRVCCRSLVTTTIVTCDTETPVAKRVSEIVGSFPVMNRQLLPAAAYPLKKL